MERIFVKDHGDRYPAGRVCDYPLDTWKTFFPGFEKFTKTVEEVAAASVRKVAKNDATH